MDNSGQTKSPKIETLLEECVRRKASDIHIQYGLPPILRIDGALAAIPNTPVLNEQMLQDLIFATMDEDQQKIYMKDKEFDYSFAFGDIARFRVNAFHERGKKAAAFRLIPNQVPALDTLGMPAVVSTFADFRGALSSSPARLVPVNPPLLLL